MNNLAILERKNTVTSLELVEQINFFREQEGNKTELGHNDLLKIIRDEFEEEISLGKISQSTYKNDRGREYPMFELTFNQARQVLVRESKFVRKHIMFYIEELEKQISLGVPRNFKEALRLAYEQQEIIETLQLESKIKDQQISELQPKASYYDYVLQCKGVVAISIIAKDFGIKSGQELNKLLHKLGIQFNQGGVWLLYSKYADKGYTQTKTHPYFRTDGTPDSRVQTYWTQKGRLFLYELLKNNGYLPNIEKEYSKEA